MLSKIAHDHVVETYRHGKGVRLPGRNGNYCLLVQEYATQGNLLEFMKKYRPNMPQRRLLFREVIEGV